MKKVFSILFMTVLLSACGHQPLKPEQLVVTKVQRIVVVPPAEMTKLPEKVKDIDVQKATQKDVSLWLNAKEKYTNDLEDIIAAISNFLLDAQKKADKDTTKEPEESGRH